MIDSADFYLKTEFSLKDCDNSSNFSENSRICFNSEYCLSVICFKDMISAEACFYKMGFSGDSNISFSETACYLTSEA